ncbi:MAG: YbaN family protein [Chloroflexi bacterium]|nr:YbaN family protein [Chloroflexota bacterium]
MRSDLQRQGQERVTRVGLKSLAKVGLIVLGSVCVGLGIIGIILPGMPSTVFFLMAAACYVRSSDRLYQRLISNKIIGRQIRLFREKRAMPMRAKVIALACGWTAISLSAIFAFQSVPLKGLMVALGIIMTVVILSVKTLQPDDMV